MVEIVIGFVTVNFYFIEIIWYKTLLKKNTSTTFTAPIYFSVSRKEQLKINNFKLIFWPFMTFEI